MKETLDGENIIDARALFSDKFYINSLIPEEPDLEEEAHALEQDFKQRLVLVTSLPEEFDSEQIWNNNIAPFAKDLPIRLGEVVNIIPFRPKKS